MASSSFTTPSHTIDWANGPLPRTTPIVATTALRDLDTRASKDALSIKGKDNNGKRVQSRGPAPRLYREDAVLSESLPDNTPTEQGIADTIPRFKTPPTRPISQEKDLDREVTNDVIFDDENKNDDGDGWDMCNEAERYLALGKEGAKHKGKSEEKREKV